MGSFICADLEPSYGDLGAVLNDLEVVLGRFGREDGSRQGFSRIYGFPKFVSCQLHLRVQDEVRSENVQKL